MVPPSSGRISRVPPYSSTAGHFLRPTGLSPALAGLSIPLRSFSMPRNPSGLLPFRSPLLRESRLISFPPGTEMFQFPGFASSGLCIHLEDTRMRGFPHSESRQSKALCASCRTFGAWPVLRRRLMPRHPPRAFLRLNPVSSDLARSCSLHEQLESTIDSWCFKSLCACCFFVCCRQSFQYARHRSDGVSCARGRLPGAKETRTPNIQLAKLALYQLSYNPDRYGPEWT